MKIENYSYFEFDNCDGNTILYRKEKSYVIDMLIEYEGIFIFVRRLLDELDNIEERIIFNDSEREAIEYKQEFVNDRSEEELDRNFIIYMVRENV